MYILNYDLPQKQTYNIVEPENINNRFAIDGERVYQCNGDNTKVLEDNKIGSNLKLQGNMKNGKITWENVEPKNTDMKYANHTIIATFDKKKLTLIGVVLFFQNENGKLTVTQLMKDNFMTLEEIKKCDFIRLRKKLK